MAEFCLPLGLTCEEGAAIEGIMHVSRALAAGQALVHAGEPMRALYAVRAGCFKTTMLDQEGNERVVEFHLPSELIGLDAIYSGVHPSDISAVSIGKLCVFPYDSLMKLAAKSPHLIENLMKLLSKNLLMHFAYGVDNTADQRLAGFLLRLSLRMPQRGEANDRFLLPMRRVDIASHLRVANGTLSRLIAALQEKDLVRIDDRLVEIVDFEGLQQAAGPLADIVL